MDVPEENISKLSSLSFATLGMSKYDKYWF